MSFRIHEVSPADDVERAFFRIQQEQMVDVPVLNPELSVSAVDFQRWQGHWLGILLTPWCMSVLLIPGSAENWVSTGQNQRRFVKFPAGDFAFLGSDEPEMGEYQSCPLFSAMGQFSSQAQAIMTARASLVGLLSSANQVPVAPKDEKPAGLPSLSRRRFLGVR